MLQNLKIRHKLMLIMVAPILGLLVYSARDVANDYTLLKDMQATRTLTMLDVQVGTLCHEIQKERGYSSGFINTKGEKFRNELVEQRHRVDAAFEKVRGFEGANRNALDMVKGALDGAEGVLEGLKGIRERIDAHALSGQDSYAFFTGLIGSYTDVTGTIAITSKKREVMRDATAYYAFVQAKEQTGRERATINGALGAGKFDEERLRLSYTNLAAQRTYLDLFRKYGSPEALAAFEEKAKSEAFRKAEEMRDAILAKGASAPPTIAPEEWFRTVTAKIDLMKEVEDFQAAHILKTAEGVERSARGALALSIVLVTILSGIALITGFLVMRSITHPLSKMVHVLEDIAEGEGDLTRRLKVDRRDELGEVSLWFNRFVDNVQGIVAQVAATTSQVSSSVNALNLTAEQIAGAVEKVAMQSAGVSTAGEEMSATSNEISNNCLMAAEASTRASRTAQDGALVVQETLVGMQCIATSVEESARTVASLGERSDQIGAIVDTIEDIADQTNLLALNAAIEAARAGEQGRGFAVVADEVRALAERTTRATKEIGAMIRAIQGETAGAVTTMQNGMQQVAKGMESSRKSGDALEEIQQAINEVTAQFQHIATAAEEQTAVTSEMSTSMHEINEVVNETSEGSYRTARAAADLSLLAGELQQMVGRFRLG